MTVHDMFKVLSNELDQDLAINVDRGQKIGPDWLPYVFARANQRTMDAHVWMVEQCISDKGKPYIHIRAEVLGND